MDYELQHIDLELFLKTSNDAIYIEDDQDRIIEVNQKACDLLGYSREELRAKRIPDLQAPDYKREYGTVVRQDVIQSLNKPFETEVLHKDGRVIPVEITVSMMREDNDGHFIACAIARDLTERKEAEDKVRFSESLLRSMMESPEQNLIWAVDLEGKYLFFNKPHQERMKEFWGADIAIGDRPFDFIDDAEYRNSCNVYYRHILNGDSTNTIDELTDQQGNVRYFENFSSPIFDSEKKIVGAVVYAFEITARKKAEKALAKSLEEKKILLQEVHHRVKNNLTIISSMLAMHMDSLESEKDRSIFRSCQNRISTMSQMHEQLYKADDLRNISLQEYLTSIARIVHSTYETSNNRIDLSLNIENLHFDMDSSVPIGLIVNELLSNSFKHAFDGQPSGAIDLTVKKREEGSLLLSIKDNGKGVADEAALFESPSLGFTLINALADQLSGTLSISNNGGLEVSLVFPAPKPSGT